MFRYVHKQKLVFKKNSHQKKKNSIPIREIVNTIIRTDGYVIIKMYVDGIIQKQPVKNSIPMEMHFVNDFKRNLLINNNIFIFQRVIINYGQKTTIVGSCQNFIIPTGIHTRVSPNTKSTIKTKSSVIILPSATVQIPVIYKNSILIDREFLYD